MLSATDPIPPPKEEELNKILAKLSQNQSRDSDNNTYGEDYYNSPLTNLDYTETTGNFNISEFLYNLTKTGGASTPLVSAAQNITSMHDGHTVITDVVEISNLSIDALAGMDAPQYFAEPGYLVSFRLAVNDPLMSLKVQAKGYGENSYTIADYSMRKMAILGLGMTLGEAEEPVFTDEGETSRDVSGQPSTEYPWLVRYKHLPTGKETDYEKYKSTDDDIWIVAAYTPKVYPKFNSLFFDIFNGNSSGPRMIHHLQIKRYIIMDTKKMIDTPDHTKSVLNVDTNQLIANLLKQDTGGEVTAPPVFIGDINAPPVSGGIPAPTVGPIEQTPVTSNYTIKRRQGNMQKTVPFYYKNPQTIASISKSDQSNPIFKDILKEEMQAYNTLMSQKYKRMSKLKRVQ